MKAKTDLSKPTDQMPAFSFTISKEARDSIGLVPEQRCCRCIDYLTQEK